MGTFTEAHELAEPRCRLTRRAVHWATDALAEDDTAVNALAHRLGVDWHTVCEPVKLEAHVGWLTRAGCPVSARSGLMSTSGDPAGSAPVVNHVHGGPHDRQQRQGPSAAT